LPVIRPHALDEPERGTRNGGYLLEGLMRRVVLVTLGLGGVGAAAIVAAGRRRARPRAERGPGFDPDEVARIEVAAWRAYYDRDFRRGLLLMLRLVCGQFRLGPLDTLRAALHAVRAQKSFAPRLNDPEAALRQLTRFYAIAPRRAGVDPGELAQAELDYWVVHRRLVEQEDKAGLTDALARLHSLLFGGSAAQQRPSAEQRMLACTAVDRITGGASTDPDQDWARAEVHLRAAYWLAVRAGDGA
jgi:hypothetical protein